MEGGGAERGMSNLLRYLEPHLSSCNVELLLLDDLPIVQNLPEGIHVERLDGRGSLRRSYSELSRHWQRFNKKPDVCISFLTRSNCLNIWLKRKFGHRAIISERVHTSSHLGASRFAPLYKKITRATYPHADHIVAVSAGVADDLALNFGVARDKTSVIGNPIDGDRLAHLAEAQPSIPLPTDYFLGVGRLVPNKNFALLLKAYAQVQNAPDLVILGQGGEESQLKAQAQMLGIEERVHFAGYVDNPYPIMNKARALISTSRAEGFPNTLIEAMSLGCPVVATDCPSGPAEVLNTSAHKRGPWPSSACGMLIPMEDADALAAAMTLFCDNEIRDDYSSRAKERARDFGTNSIIESYLQILLRPLTNSENAKKPGEQP